ncbi:fungal-specific transcription factor domain-containing protein [Podospora aff. communis PSN243]|uniref:Fungal-specific transcription factor domain-containing protein n=1 Tax=Podospora aff. communis PSN243 TaxID=3040156 RepID=A0AAV9GKD5_9PEZI|nr:fungal-specific transcription factor domain-containing protein [Podospora aff. communis PSN243]
MDPDVEPKNLPGSTTASSVPRACDACRARKIRCNRESPCAHCIQAKIECTHADTRPKERGTRILLTPQYERKIDLIDRQLKGVTQLLQDLNAKLDHPTSQQQSQPQPSPSHLQVPRELPHRAASSSVPSPASHISQTSHASHADTTGPVVEGDSSLTAHSVFASNLLQKVVDVDSSVTMRDTLDTLRDIVDTMKQQPAAHEMTYPNAQRVLSLPSAAMKACQLPPIKMTVQLLQLTKHERVSSLAWIYEFFPIQRFPETCMTVYFTDDYSEADFVVVNAGLHILFWTYARLVSDEEATQYLQMSRLCAMNLETALANLPLHLPATSDHILALLSGAFYAIEISKPSLCWILITKASELCQTLGYHRAETYKNEDPEDARHKEFLFWAVYLLDRSLCLRLGRSSSIQDYDITVPYPSGTVPHRIAIAEFMKLWIKGSQIQGLIYERLYSPEAVRQTEVVRRARMQSLVQQLKELEDSTNEVIARYDEWSKGAAGDELTNFFNTSDHVLRLSLLTLVHRAVPNPAGSPTTFSSNCIQAARATLDLHQDCITAVNKSSLGLFSTYMHWTILFSPFVPFIVLFCQVIETRDQTDLSRLQAFVTSISRPESTSLTSEPETEAITKVRKLFQVLCHIAQHYVDAYTTDSSSSSGMAKVYHSHTQSTGNTEIDSYLATLGFPAQGIPNNQQQQQEQQQLQQSEEPGGVNPMLWMGSGTQLEDWFYSNQQMMDFLEDGALGIS